MPRTEPLDINGPLPVTRNQFTQNASGANRNELFIDIRSEPHHCRVEHDEVVCGGCHKPLFGAVAGEITVGEKCGWCGEHVIGFTDERWEKPGYVLDMD